MIRDSRTEKSRKTR